MVHKFALTALFLIVAAASTGLHAGDEVTLRDGRVIAGELISPPDALTVRIRVAQGTMRAVMTFPAVEVVQVARGVNERLNTLAALRSEVAAYTQVPLPHPQGWWQQIQGFAALNESIDYQAAIHDFLAVFPDYVPAREALGQQRYEGEWMSETEIKLAQGLVRYQGAWRSADEVETLIAQEAQLRGERQHQRDMRRSQRELQQEAARINRLAQGAYQPFTYTHPLDRVDSPYYRNFQSYYARPLPPYRPHSSGYQYQFGTRGGHSSSNGFSFAFTWNN